MSRPKHPERLDREQHATIVNAVACSYCGAPAGQPCHYTTCFTKVERRHEYPDMVHRSRTTAFHNQGGQA